MRKFKKGAYGVILDTRVKEKVESDKSELFRCVLGREGVLDKMEVDEK